MDTAMNFSDMDDADYFAALLLKQLRQEITDEELQYLEAWKASHPSFAQASESVNDSERLLADLQDMKQIDMEGWWQKISAQVEITKKPVPFYRRWYAYAAAAMVLLIAGAVTWQYWPAEKPAQAETTPFEPASLNMSPGGNKAILTLANGRVIDVGNADTGKLALDANRNVIKVQDGALKYESTGFHERADQQLWAAWNLLTPYNKLSTPRGGQYSLELPDGSKVWLNAASSITFPTHFLARERRVTITGEVYFEVAAVTDADKANTPFIVTVEDPAGKDLANVEVLGTRFNIMAYGDEQAVKTTLLNGKVKVSVPHAGTAANTALLMPGQQALIPQAGNSNSNAMKVIDVDDLEAAFAWKNGYISLKDTDIRSIMRILSRWYNVEIGYEGKTPDYRFGGAISRKVNLSTVLKTLEYGGVHFKIENNKIIVLP
ncbi:FecR family protein [Longitalea arenae]|uniref:FecR family protein n=1 Tax=Longitalea arenae TaxID=2812558 RepID=UPI00196826BD|nr:FecR family protein [Longitalea arenae]